MTKLLNVILGLSLIIFGIGILISPVAYHPVYRVNLDLTNIRWPFGLILIGSGIACLFLVFSKRARTNNFMICPDCGEVFNAKSKEECNSCEGCGCQLEELDGFYDRHPESNKKI
jgi:hypothetical protein